MERNFYLATWFHNIILGDKDASPLDQSYMISKVEATYKDGVMGYWEIKGGLMAFGWYKDNEKALAEMADVIRKIEKDYPHIPLINTIPQDYVPREDIPNVNAFSNPDSIGRSLNRVLELGEFQKLVSLAAKKN